MLNLGLLDIKPIYILEQYKELDKKKIGFALAGV